jgi:hypothetical protein
MMKRVALGIGLLAGFMAQAAFGQGMTDAQRRKIHLPYVRAATDCYAGVIRANTSTLDLARENRWYDAISAVGDSCNQALLAMIDVHNRLYGPGTGVTFAKGPYLEDLPRAIGVRLKDDLARRSNEVEQAQAGRRQRIEEATRSRNLLRDRMYDCTTKELNQLVASSESAEVLTSAAMTLCSREVDATLDAAIELARLEGSTSSDLRENLSDVVRKNILAGAVQAKASAKKLDASPSMLPAATSQPSPRASGALQSPEECLKAAASLREGQLVDQEKLISMMLDMCRPEIENAARTNFLADPNQSLPTLRTQALEEAVKYAKALLKTQ